jgi:hypothetical protein
MAMFLKFSVFTLYFFSLVQQLSATSENPIVDACKLEKAVDPIDSVIVEYHLSGPVEINTDLVVQLWSGPSWSLVQWKDEYRLEKRATESKDNGLKATITEKQALELIERLGLTQLQSRVWGIASDWIQLRKKPLTSVPFEINLDVLASRWRSSWYIWENRRGPTSKFRLKLAVGDATDDIDFESTISEQQANALIEQLFLLPNIRAPMVWTWHSPLVD